MYSNVGLLSCIDITTFFFFFLKSDFFVVFERPPMGIERAIRLYLMNFNLISDIITNTVILIFY